EGPKFDDEGCGDELGRSQVSGVGPVRLDICVARTGPDQAVDFLVVRPGRRGDHGDHPLTRLKAVVEASEVAAHVGVGLSRSSCSMASIRAASSVAWWKRLASCSTARAAPSRVPGA